MRLVFDAAEWRKTGDVGDNSQFWKPAKILKLGSDGTCLVRFEDGRESDGHYYRGTRPMPKHFCVIDVGHSRYPMPAMWVDINNPELTVCNKHHDEYNGPDWRKL